MINLLPGEACPFNKVLLTVYLMQLIRPVEPSTATDLTCFKIPNHTKDIGYFEGNSIKDTIRIA